MRHTLAFFWTILLFAASVTLVVGVAPVLADCGGSPCACGSTVNVDTTLSAATDPVCFTGSGDTVCPATGLFVNPGIKLNLGGCTIRGTAGVGTGVAAGADAEVGGGKIIGFEHGVSLTGDKGSVSNVKISGGSGHGIVVAGNENTIAKAVVSTQGADCVRVSGHANLVSHVQALDCVFSGIGVFGNDNRVEQGKALRNGFEGIRIVGDQNTVFSNQIDKNDDRGIFLVGKKNTVARNKVLRNRFGIIFDSGSEDSVADSNRVEQNAVRGIVDAGPRATLVRNVVLRSGECGIVVFGNGAVLDQNQARANSLGVCVEGSGATVTRNLASGNSINGINVGEINVSVGGVFDKNRTTNNDGFGIKDFGGAGANTYTSNTCTGNGAGSSDPAGLCQ